MVHVSCHQREKTRAVPLALTLFIGISYVVRGGGGARGNQLFAYALDVYNCQESREREDKPLPPVFCSAITPAHLMNSSTYMYMEYIDGSKRL